jgi:hypothetical protein
MPKYTTKQIEAEISALENTEAQAAVHYLKQELLRRSKSGRPVKSKLSRKEQVRQNVANHRAKKKAQDIGEDQK